MIWRLSFSAGGVALIALSLGLACNAVPTAKPKVTFGVAPGGSAVVVAVMGRGSGLYAFGPGGWKPIKARAGDYTHPSLASPSRLAVSYRPSASEPWRIVVGSLIGDRFNEERVISNEGMALFFPTWARNGEVLAFAQARTYDARGWSDITLHTWAAESGMQALTDTRFDDVSSLSVDKSGKVVFSARQHSSQGLEILALDLRTGGVLERLRPGNWPMDPVMHPTSGTVVYIGSAGNYRTEVYSMGVSDQRGRKVTILHSDLENLRVDRLSGRVYVLDNGSNGIRILMVGLDGRTSELVDVERHLTRR